MLGRVVLIALQLAGGWAGAPYVLKYVSVGGDAQVFVHGAVFAGLVWVIGLVGSQVLKGVGVPSVAAFAFAFAGGLIGAALIVFKVPALLPLAFPQLLLPLGLAIVGYAIKA
jgi:hypothetical protein